MTIVHSTLCIDLRCAAMAQIALWSTTAVRRIEAATVVAGAAIIVIGTDVAKTLNGLQLKSNNIWGV